VCRCSSLRNCDDNFDPDEEKCSCGKEFIWREIVDETNGLGCVEQIQIEKIADADVERCPACGQITKIIEEAKYKPTERREKVAVCRIERKSNLSAL